MTDAEREFISLIIGHRVRQVRRSRRISQEALAQGVGSQSMISLIEGGHQLPLPDVMWTLATRLDDPVLTEYARSLDDNTLRHFSVSSHNEEDLLSILVNHRGRWHPSHERIASQLCHHYYDTRNMEQVQELCKLIIHHVSHSPLRAEAFYFLGSSYLQQHKFKDGEHWLKKAEELFDHLTDNMRGRLSYNLGYAYTYLDIQVLALWYASRAVEIFNRIHDFLNQGNSMGLLGTIQTRLGRLEEAKRSLTIGLDILRRWDTSPMNEGRILATLAEVCWLLGEDEAATFHVESAKKVVLANDFLCQADIHRLEAYLAMRSGRMNDAYSSLEHGLEAATAAEDPHSLGQAHLLAVQSYQNADEKLRAAQSAYDITRETNHHILHAVSAESVSKLLSEKSVPDDKIMDYMQSALDSYRTYVHKNSMFTHLIDSLAIHPNNTAEMPENVNFNELEDSESTHVQQESSHPSTNYSS